MQRNTIYITSANIVNIIKIETQDEKEIFINDNP